MQATTQTKPYCENCRHYAGAGLWSAPCRMGGIPENRGKSAEMARIVRARNSCADWAQRLEVAA